MEKIDILIDFKSASLKDLNKELERLKTELKNVPKGSEDFKKISKNISTINKEIKETSKALKSIDTAPVKNGLDGLSSSAKKTTKALQDTGKAGKATAKDIGDTLKAAQGDVKASGGFVKLELQIRKLKKELQAAADAGDKVTFDKLKGQLDELEDSLEVVQLSTKQLDDALQAVPGPASKVGDAMKGLDGIMKIFAANPFVATVAIIAGALLGIYKALQQTEKGMAALSKVGEAFGRIITPIFEFIADAAVPAVETLAKGINLLAKAFTGQTEQQAKMNKLQKEYATAVKEGSQENAKRVSELQSLNKILQDSSQNEDARRGALEKLKGMLPELKDLEFGRKGVLDQVNAAVLSNIQLLDLQIKTDAKRAIALKLQTDIENRNLEIQRKKLELRKEETATDVDYSRQSRIYELKKDIQALDAQNIADLKDKDKLVAESDALLTDVLKKEQKAAQVAADNAAARKKTEDATKEAEEKRKKRQEQAEEERKQAYAKSSEALQQALDEDLAKIEKQRAEDLSNLTLTEEERLKINAKYDFQSISASVAAEELRKNRLKLITDPKEREAEAKRINTALINLETERVNKTTELALSLQEALIKSTGKTEEAFKSSSETIQKSLEGIKIPKDLSNLDAIFKNSKASLAALAQTLETNYKEAIDKVNKANIPQVEKETLIKGINDAYDATKKAITAKEKETLSEVVSLREAAYRSASEDLATSLKITLNKIDEEIRTASPFEKIFTNSTKKAIDATNKALATQLQANQKYQQDLQTEYDNGAITYEEFQKRLTQAQLEESDIRKNIQVGETAAFEATIDFLNTKLDKLKEYSALYLQYSKSETELLRSEYDLRIGEAQKYYDFLLSNDALTQEQRVALEQESAAEIAKLRYEQGKAIAEQSIKEANINFALQAATITISTAEAVAKSIALSPETFGLPWSAINAAAGAVQLLAANNARQTAINDANAQLASLKPPKTGGNTSGSRRKGFATGGYVEGPGSPTSDSIPANLSNGEFVINAKATKEYRPMLETINNGGGAEVFTELTQTLLKLDARLGSLEQKMSEPSKSYIVYSELQDAQAQNDYLNRRAKL